jgi:DNA-binding GntR family transcriptional regulator
MKGFDRMDAEQLAGSLREDIESGRRGPGERLAVPALQAEYGTGYSTVVEALDLLAGEGLVQKRPNKVAIVASEDGQSLATAPERVAAAIKADIKAGRLEAGNELPSLAESMVRHGVPGHAVSAAHKLLAGEGVILRGRHTRPPIVAGSDGQPAPDRAQVSALILKMIKGWPKGVELPSREAMAQAFGASRKTVRYARAQLIRDGVVTYRSIDGVTGRKLVVADLSPEREEGTELLRERIEEAASDGTLPALHELAERHGVPAQAVWTVLAELLDREPVRQRYGRERTPDDDEVALKTLAQLTCEALEHDVTVNKHWVVGASLPALAVLATRYRVAQHILQEAEAVLAVHGILALRPAGHRPRVVGERVVRAAKRETVAAVITQIIDGWEPGTPLPPRSLIARELGVKTGAVQGAVLQLVGEKVLESGGRYRPMLIAGTAPRSEG